MDAERDQAESAAGPVPPGVNTHNQVRVSRGSRGVQCSSHQSLCSGFRRQYHRLSTRAVHQQKERRNSR